jgi:hypothetical protein
VMVLVSLCCAKEGCFGSKMQYDGIEGRHSEHSNNRIHNPCWQCRSPYCEVWLENPPLPLNKTTALGMPCPHLSTDLCIQSSPSQPETTPHTILAVTLYSSESSEPTRSNPQTVASVALRAVDANRKRVVFKVFYQ